MTVAGKDGSRIRRLHMLDILRTARGRTALAVASLVVLLGVLVQWLRMLVSSARSIAGRYDFSSYYAAARLVHTNPHANPYDDRMLAAAGAASHVLVSPPLPYTYPPLFAIVLSPFTVLSFRTLSRVWLFGNAALWLAITVLVAIEIRHLLGETLATRQDDTPSGWLARLRADPTPLVSLALSAWLSLTFAPAAQTMATGQINFLVLLPLAAVPWLSRHHHERWVGVAVAVAAMLKLTPALLIIYLLLRRRWAAAAAAGVALLVMAAACVLVVGPHVVLASIPQALRVGTSDAALGHNEALFAPLLTALGTSSAVGFAGLLAHLLTLALAIAVGYVLWRVPPNGAADSAWREQREEAGYGLALCAMVLLSPTVWVHHYVWVLPAAAIALTLTLRHLLALGAAHDAFALARTGLVILICIALGWAMPYAWDTDPHPATTQLAHLPLWPLLLELRPLAALALAGVLAVWYAHPAAQRNVAAATPAVQELA
jgi:hypothetical protein